MSWSCFGASFAVWKWGCTTNSLWRLFELTMATNFEGKKALVTGAGKGENANSISMLNEVRFLQMKIRSISSIMFTEFCYFPGSELVDGVFVMSQIGAYFFRLIEEGVLYERETKNFNGSWSYSSWNFSSSKLFLRCYTYKQQALSTFR